MSKTLKRSPLANAPQPTLKEWYAAHIVRLRAEGKPLLTYACPCCDEAIDIQRPGVGEIWDSMIICPHCDDMHFRISYGDAGRVDAMAIDFK